MALILYPELLESRTYTFQRLRYMVGHMPIQEGVVNIFDYAVVQRAAGANMSVDVSPGGAFINGDTGTRQGIYHLVNDATVNVAVSAAHATLPRIDQVHLRIFDSTVSGGSDVPTLFVAAGTATAGATLDNRSGAAALTNDTIRLADISVPAASTSVVTANLRDRRLWSSGACFERIGNNAADVSTTSGIFVNPSSTFDTRLECSGAPLTITFSGVAANTLAGAEAVVAIVMDAVTEVIRATCESATNQQDVPFSMTRTFQPAAGSHLFTIGLEQIGGGTAVLRNTSLRVPHISFIENPRQFSANA